MEKNLYILSETVDITELSGKLTNLKQIDRYIRKVYSLSPIDSTSVSNIYVLHHHFYIK